MKKIFIGIILIANVNIYAQGYNPDKAAEYANFWCNKRNTATSPYLDTKKWGGPYVNYGIYGGDCAAFVSQCLRAGGLDLSKGTDGSGAYVKPDSVIAGATELVEHLEKQQKIVPKRVTGFYPPDNHDVGDPMFELYSSSGNGVAHSYFCSSLNDNATQLYSYHTSDVCNANVSSDLKYKNLKFFHIPASVPIPAHCTNCKLDGDEIGIDCGGSCPTCDRIDYKNYNSNTSSSNPLPKETHAIRGITAGNANVVVYPQHKVAFYSAGTIELLPGFSAESGSSFDVQPKSKRLDATADCNSYCDPFLPNLFNRIGYPFTLELTNASHVIVNIFQMPQRWNSSIAHCYSNSFSPSHEGEVLIWDLNSGSPRYNATMMHTEFKNYTLYEFRAQISILSCQGRYFSYEYYFYVIDPSYSDISPENDLSDIELEILSERMNLESLEIMNDPLSENSFKHQEDDYANNISIYPNPNNGSFAITNNNTSDPIQKVEIYNTVGQLIEVVESDFQSIQLAASVQGTLIARIYTSSGVCVKKMIVQKK